MLVNMGDLPRPDQNVLSQSVWVPLESHQKQQQQQQQHQVQLNNSSSVMEGTGVMQSQPFESMSQLQQKRASFYALSGAKPLSNQVESQQREKQPSMESSIIQSVALDPNGGSNESGKRSEAALGNDGSSQVSSDNKRMKLE
jgi:hypothetical protein